MAGEIKTLLFLKWFPLVIFFLRQDATLMYCLLVDDIFDISTCISRKNPEKMVF